MVTKRKKNPRPAIVCGRAVNVPFYKASEAEMRTIRKALRRSRRQFARGQSTRVSDVMAYVESL